MAICAAHNALVHFALQRRDRCAAHDESTDCEILLTADVVEIEHDNVTFAAIDAMVLRKMRKDDAPISYRVTLMQRKTARIRPAFSEFADAFRVEKAARIRPMIG